MMNLQTHPHRHAHTSMHTDTCAQMHAQVQAQMHACMHAFTHACTHNTHTSTCTHKHTCSRHAGLHAHMHRHQNKCNYYCIDISNSPIPCGGGGGIYYLPSCIYIHTHHQNEIQLIDHLSAGSIITPKRSHEYLE